MKRLLALVAVIAVHVLCCGGILAESPAYRGRALSEWLTDFGYASDFRTEIEIRRNDEAAEAVRRIGTNALPLLLSRLSSKSSDRRYEGLMGLHALSNAAAPAISRIIPLLNANDDGIVKDSTVALVGLGPCAGDALNGALTNRLREARLIALAWFGKHPESASAAWTNLVIAAHDPDVEIRRGALTALGSSGPASRVIPILISALEDPDADCRMRACLFLASFGVQAQAAVAPLTKTLGDSAPAVRTQAEIALKRIAPNANAKRE